MSKEGTGDFGQCLHSDACLYSKDTLAGCEEAGYKKQPSRSGSNMGKADPYFSSKYITCSLVYSKSRSWEP